MLKQTQSQGDVGDTFVTEMNGLDKRSSTEKNGSPKRQNCLRKSSDRELRASQKGVVNL